MTDYSHLIGPEPTPAPSPKFPTPWEAVGDGELRADNGAYIGVVDLFDDEDNDAVAAFIAEAVNEKIGRAAIPSRVQFIREQDPEVPAGAARVHDWHIVVEEPMYRSDVEYWKSDRGTAFYRLTSEARGAGEYKVDAYYADTEQTDLADLPEVYVRECKNPCTVHDVPEEFRL